MNFTHNTCSSIQRVISADVITWSGDFEQRPLATKSPILCIYSDYHQSPQNLPCYLSTPSFLYSPLFSGWNFSLGSCQSPIFYIATTTLDCPRNPTSIATSADQVITSANRPPATETRAHGASYGRTGKFGEQRPTDLFMWQNILSTKCLE
jgi:hypothetical protein